MKINTFDKNFKRILLENQLLSVTVLQNAFQQIGELYSKVTDETIKLYQQANPDAPFKFDISISALRNYLQPFGYSIRQNSPYIVKELTISEFKSLYGEGHVPVSEPHVSTSVREKDLLNVGQKIAIGYADRYETYKDYDLLSVRCAESVRESFKAFCEQFKFCQKSFLFSYVVEKGIKSIYEE